jgi:hypothetical protein
MATPLSDLTAEELAEVRAGCVPGEPLDLPDCGYQVFDDAGDLADDLTQTPDTD